MTLDRTDSRALYERARTLLPGGVSSPVRAFGAVGGTPRFVRRVDGAWIEDVEGRRHVDCMGGWGTAILGHAHPEVVAAVRDAAGSGLNFGACCAAEGDLAEMIAGALPAVERVRFTSSGTEAVMTALRLARGVTGREMIVKFHGGYHGHADAMLVAAGSGAVTHGVPDSAGVPAGAAAPTLLAPYNDVGAVEALFAAHGGSIAAVIVEPVAGNMGMVLPEEGFLEALRAACDAHGALLVMDEVMTGFRVAWGGHQRLSGVRPDLTCLGKVIGGGLPVAAVAGPAALMERLSPTGPVYQAGTLSGHPLGMAAGLVTLRRCARRGFYDDLHATSTRLAEGLADAARGADLPVQTCALGGMLGFFFSDRPVRRFDDARACDHERFARFFHGMLERRVWLPPSPYEAWFVSAAHGSTEVALILDAAAETFRDLAP